MTKNEIKKIKNMIVYHLNNELEYAKNNNYDDEQLSNLKKAIKLVKSIKIGGKN